MNRFFCFILIFLGLIPFYGWSQVVPQNPLAVLAPPLKESLHLKGNTHLTRYLNEKAWNFLFPHRYGIGKKDEINHNPDFYSFKAFVSAARLFPDFLSEGPPSVQKRELAAFLANIAQETSGGWEDAPGGYFKWGLYWLEENDETAKDEYVDSTWKKYPAVPGKQYFGRGPKQFSWNYNYGQFSIAWYGVQDTLLNEPDRLSKDPVLSMASAIWFWMTPQRPKPSCHDIMVGKWIPNAQDSLKKRMPGFSSTVNVINGGLECGKGIKSIRTAYRYAYYRYFCNYFKIDPGDHIECEDEIPFGK